MLLSIFTQFMIFTFSFALKFKNITVNIIPSNSGIIAAFGDLNTDGYTDIFALQQNGSKLQIYNFVEFGQKFKPYISCTFRNVITSVVPGDFNGDSVLDVLITLTNESDALTFDVKILWGNDGNIDCNSSTLFSVANQPLVVDFNGDMIPDIIGETKEGNIVVWLSSAEKNFTKELLSKQKFANPHSSGLIDINNDLAADILILGEDNIEVWINNGSGFSKNGNILYPKTDSPRSRLQATFIDFNLNADIDIIMPVCYDPNCEKSAIMLYNKSLKKWEILLDNMKYKNAIWGFKLPLHGSPLHMAALPVTLRAGDIDLDGYPDFLVVLQTKSGNATSRLVILKNVPCVNCSHCIFDRCLEIVWDIPGLQDLSNIEIATFFDIYENGILDILASSYNNGWKIHALENSEIIDSCFMKVLVSSNSNSSNVPYGVNQPGPLIQYCMINEDCHNRSSSRIQMAQSAYFPLYLPYSVFGLGQTPNFVDSLKVAIPAKFNKSVHKREWTQIIPNSQIIVITKPFDNEKMWVWKLFVIPNHYVFLTCMTLLGTCAFIGLIVGFLQWRERKEDKKEKKQDAYRFHFDAM